MKRIFIDKDKCMGCLSCTIACIRSHSQDDSIYGVNLQDPASEARNHIELTYKSEYVPIFCRHCTEPECVNTCITGALSKDSETGYVIYDKSVCASCLMCVMSCPYGVLKPAKKGKKEILKCDMCTERGEPYCVNNCPMDALELKEVKK